MWLRGGAGVQVLMNFLLAPKEEILGLYLLVRCGAEKKEGRVRLKSYQQSKIKKNRVGLFIKLVY